MNKNQPNTRELLLSTGFMIAQKEGIKSLTIRRLAREANVNLGSFVYHFKNRENFLHELIQRWHHPLLAQLELGIDYSLSPLKNLEMIATQVTQFFIENKKFISLLIRDLLAGEKVLHKFAETNILKQIRFTLEVIKKAQQEQLVIESDPMEILVFLAGALGLPIITQELFIPDNHSPSNALQNDMNLIINLPTVASNPEYVSKRIQWALQAITVEKKL